MEYSLAVQQIEIIVFYKHFFNIDISLHFPQNLLNFSVCVLHYHIEGTVSQIVYMCLFFCFIKFRK